MLRIVALLFLGSATAAAAQQAEIDAVRNRFVQAVRLKNADSLAATVSSEIVMTAGRDSIIFRQAPFRDYWAERFAAMDGPNPFDLTPVSLHFLAPDIAVEMTNYGPIGGPPVGNAMFFYKKWGPRWYITYWRRGTPPLPR